MTRSPSPASSIAVVGMACRYPDAPTSDALWENVLARRRAFRRIPAERLRLEDYDVATAGPVDSIDCSEAALLEDWEFDRVRFRVAGSTFRSTDLTHWLALQVAAEALADAGFAEAAKLPKNETGVIVGNSLAGEFSRAQLLRLRWPYVRRIVHDALRGEESIPPHRLADLLDRLEAGYKAPFEPPGEDTLAGGLANTIAGRICNHFDFGGGGYTVDGACSSSLLAVANACSSLVAGDLDVALVGGVDLSLDPFELVGFSRTGALSDGEMRVFDRRSRGFLPGEGSGFLVLMRSEDALARHCRVLAVIAGWGVSSDGNGGLTRPESTGQIRALRRAYRKAGFGPETVGLFEAHGTGTPVGDTVELETLSRLLREAGARSPAAVGSIKALIGHTKAAAGLAGSIKAIQALRHAVLPPTVGCENPRPSLVGDPGAGGDAPLLRILDRTEPWTDAGPRRAGVSAMGFGGINTHLALEEALETTSETVHLGVGRGGSSPRRGLSATERLLDRSAQDAELLLLSAPDAETLASSARSAAAEAESLSHAELADRAAELAEEVAAHPQRCAIVARTPAQAAERLRRAATLLEENGARAALLPNEGIAVGKAEQKPTIGLLFGGQGGPLHADGGDWRRRFEEVDAIYRLAGTLSDWSAGEDRTSTAVAQPLLAAAALSGLEVLERIGLNASVAVGHSLGELVALHWAGALGDRRTLLRLARSRGRAMERNTPPGAMVSLRCPHEQAQALIEAMTAEEVEGLSIGAVNAPDEVVVAGPAEPVDALRRRAKSRGVPAVRLAVSRAFHSPMMEGAVDALAAALREALEAPGARFCPLPGRSVVSTLTGLPLRDDCDLGAHLKGQLTAPVRFAEALATAETKAGGVDLWIEVGSGRVLTGLAQRCGVDRAISLNAGGSSLAGLLTAVGALFCLGATIEPAVLFRDRFTRSVTRPRRFLANPCERAPLTDGLPEPPPVARPDRRGAPPPVREQRERGVAEGHLDPLETVRRLVATRAELPLDSVSDGDRMLTDLHLSSIAVGQLVVEAARRIGASPPTNPTDFADASVADVSEALRRLTEEGGAGHAEANRPPPGVASWVRPFAFDLVDRPLDPPKAGVTPPFRILALDDEDEHVARLRDLLGASAVEDSAEHGVLLWLRSGVDWPSSRRAVELLLASARAALAEREGPFVLAQPVPADESAASQERGIGAAFARCLHLERGSGSVHAVRFPADAPDAVDRVVAEARAAANRSAHGGFSEAVYDRSGRRRVPLLRLIEPAGPEARTDEPDLGLCADDTLVVTGGGRGIAAECALALARATGAALALLGRSRPEDSPELTANLDRLEAAGVRFRYLPADVTDREAVAAAVAAAQRELGPVTAVLHGAGRNEPRLIARLDPEHLTRTRAPKVDGLAHLLAAVEPSRLRLLVAFGSIIARTGMPGEADYALANEELAVAVERFSSAHPRCRCHILEWSVWSGVGMAERLSSVEGLSAQGISPIPTDQGIRALRAVLSRSDVPVSVVLSGRFGDPPTVETAAPELPLLRFLERPRVHVPGVELVVDTEIGGETDAYVSDHVLDGEPLWPAVMGLEAMMQVATALEGDDGVRRTAVFEKVELLRPVVVPSGETVTVRLAALRYEPGRVSVAVRCSTDGFQTDHFRARCHLRPSAPSARRPSEERRADDGDDLVATLEPARDLYGSILFHEGRFRRLRAYRRLHARDCLAEIAPAETSSWFARQLPGRLLLGDPGTRDAAIHAIQACIPHAILLPVGVERLETSHLEPTVAHTVEARERSRKGAELIYDLELRDSAARVVERWEGLALRIITAHRTRWRCHQALLAPFLERRLDDLLPEGSIRVGVGRWRPDDNGSRSGKNARRRTSDRLIQQLLGSANRVLRRPDGKPEASNGRAVSIAYDAGLVLTVTGSGSLGCDTEKIAPARRRPWADLLGRDRHGLALQVARETQEDPETAATRVWTAVESLRKAAYPPDAPLVFESATADGWVLLRSGEGRVATSVVTPQPSADVETPVPQVFAVLWSPESEPASGEAGVDPARR